MEQVFKNKIQKEVTVINDLINKEDIKIENMIYEIIEKQVMLDRDLAKLYHIETRVLIQKNKKKYRKIFVFK